MPPRVRPAYAPSHVPSVVPARSEEVPSGVEPAIRPGGSGSARVAPIVSQGAGHVLPYGATGAGGDPIDYDEYGNPVRRRKRRGGSGEGGGGGGYDESVPMPPGMSIPPGTFSFALASKGEGTGSAVGDLTIPDPGAGTYLVLLAAANDRAAPAAPSSITGDLTFTVLGGNTTTISGSSGSGRLTLAWAVMTGGSGAKVVHANYAGNQDAITLAAYVLTGINTSTPAAQTVTAVTPNGSGTTNVLTFAAFESAANHALVFAMGPQFTPVETASVAGFTLATGDDSNPAPDGWHYPTAVASATISVDVALGIIGVGLELRAA